MKRLKFFYQKAEEAFNRMGIVGEFQGIKFGDQKVLLVYSSGAEISSVSWEGAPSRWEEAANF